MAGLPQEYENLLHHIEGARMTAPARGKPDRTLNLIVTGAKRSGKTTNARAFGDELKERKLIDTDPVYFDCTQAGFSAQLCVRLAEEFSQAKNGMLIIDNAEKLADEPLALQTIIDLFEETGCIMAMVGDREGIAKICDLYPAVAARFYTTIDPEVSAQRAAALATREAMDQLAQLPAPLQAMKPLRIRPPEGKP